MENEIQIRKNKTMNLPITLNEKGNTMSIKEWILIRRQVRPPLYQDLTPRNKKNIIIKRIRQRDPYKIWFLGEYEVDNERAIREIIKNTELGDQLFRIEERTIKMLLEEIITDEIKIRKLPCPFCENKIDRYSEIADIFFCSKHGELHGELGRNTRNILSNFNFKDVK